MSDRIVIRKANSVVDVFFGETGFDSKHWTRFSVIKTHNGPFLKYIKGASIPQDLMMQVHKQLGV